MTYILYGIPNCDTVKKARTWLYNNRITYQFHNYKTEGISKDKVMNWLKQEAQEILINRKSTTFKNLTDQEKESIKGNASAAKIMVTHTSIIKRPVLELAGKVVAVGFKAEVYEEVLNAK